MFRNLRVFSIFLGTLSLTSLSTPAAEQSLILKPSEDTYLWELGPTQPVLGERTTLIVGTRGSRGGFAKDRGLIKFDGVSEIPPDATITSVTLTVTVTNAPPGNPSHSFQLHRMLREWKELESTWTIRLAPDVPWDAEGGTAGVDFLDAHSATTVIGRENESYTFDSTAELVADVTAWVRDTTPNYGWLIKLEDESEETSARGIFTREAEPHDPAPVLEVHYDVPDPLLIATTELADDQFCLTFQAKAGKSYRIERKDALDDSSWTVVTNIPAVEADVEIEVCDPLGGGNRFYRLGEE